MEAAGDVAVFFPFSIVASAAGADKSDSLAHC